MKKSATQFLKMAWMLLLMAMTLPTLAQTGMITGKVMVENEDEVLAKVMLHGLDGKVVLGTGTDFDGNFWFDAVPPGSYLIKANAIGDSSQLSVTVRENRITYAHITIKRQAMPCICGGYERRALRVMRWEWETTRQKLTQVMSDRSPYAYIAATRGGVYQADLGDALQSRGARTNTTTVFVDGVKLRGELQVPFAALSSVELLQGGIPAEYGDATGGIIDIKTLGYNDPDLPLHGGAYGHGHRYPDY